MKKSIGVKATKLQLKKRTVLKLKNEALARPWGGITVHNTEEANCTGNTIRTNATDFR